MATSVQGSYKDYLALLHIVEARRERKNKYSLDLPCSFIDSNVSLNTEPENSKIRTNIRILL